LEYCSRHHNIHSIQYRQRALFPNYYFYNQSTKGTIRRHQMTVADTTPINTSMMTFSPQQTKNIVRILVLLVTYEMIRTLVGILYYSLFRTMPKHMNHHTNSLLMMTDQERIMAYEHRHQCILNQSSAFNFTPLIYNAHYDWTLHSTVQTERVDGPCGIQQRFDWVIGSRSIQKQKIPRNTVWGNASMEPKTIFIHPERLSLFHDTILPCLFQHERFLLVIGDSDVTTPRQLNVGYNSTISYSIWLSLLHDPRIIHIFVEHLDEWITNPETSKVSPMPLGINPMEVSQNETMKLCVDDIIEKYPIVPFHERPLQIRLTNRIRGEKGIWKQRHIAKHVYCDQKWKQFCNSTSAPEKEDYFNEIRQYPFVLCINGGGMDPNPQLWTALLVGTIPIIISFPGERMYRDLPVIIMKYPELDRWDRWNISQDMLQTWIQQYSHMFEDVKYRRQVLETLMTDYWWKQIQSKLLESS
jgi:hypothetical protein